MPAPTSAVATSPSNSVDTWYDQGEYWSVFQAQTAGWEVLYYSPTGASWSPATGLTNTGYYCAGATGSCGVVTTSSAPPSVWVDAANHEFWYAYCLSGTVYTREITYSTGGSASFGYAQQTFAEIETGGCGYNTAIAEDTNGVDLWIAAASVGASAYSHLEAWVCASPYSSCTWTNSMDVDTTKPNAIKAYVEPYTGTEMVTGYFFKASYYTGYLYDWSGTGGSWGSAVSSGVWDNFGDAVTVGSTLYVCATDSVGHQTEFASHAYGGSSALSYTGVGTTSSTDCSMSASSVNTQMDIFYYSAGGTTIYYVQSNNLGSSWGAETVFASGEASLLAGTVQTSFGYYDGDFEVQWTSGSSSPYNARWATLAVWTLDSVTLTVSPVGGASGTFALSGGSVSPATVSGDGSAHPITCAVGSPTVTIAVPANGTDLRQVFAGDAVTQTFTCGGTGHSFTYYSQQPVTAYYSGTIALGGAPSFSGTQYGAADMPTLLTASPVTLWYDQSSAFAITRPPADSPAVGERFATGFANGTVSAGLTVDPAFSHQYSQILQVQISCQPSAVCNTFPNFEYWSFGSLMTITTSATPTTAWADVGTGASVSPVISDFSGNSYSTSPSSWVATSSDVVADPMLYVFAPAPGGGSGGSGVVTTTTSLTASPVTETTTAGQAPPAPIPPGQFTLTVIGVVSVFALTILIMSRRQIETDAEKLSKAIGSPLSLGSFDLRRPKKKGADKKASAEVGKLVSLRQLSVKMPPIPDGAKRVSQGVGKRVSFRHVDVRRKKKGE